MTMVRNFQVYRKALLYLTQNKLNSYYLTVKLLLVEEHYLLALLTLVALAVVHSLGVVLDRPLE